MAGFSRNHTGGHFWSLEALLGADELFQALSQFPTLIIFKANGRVPADDTRVVSLEDYVTHYETYVKCLTDGSPFDRKATIKLHAGMTLDDSIITSEPCPDPAFKLYRYSKPVLHVQSFEMAYLQQSNKIRINCANMKNPIHFGLTFNHPNVWNRCRGDMSSPDARTQFPNVDLIEGLTEWVKKHSEPCKITLPGREQVLPVRLGRQAGRWVNEHTGLARQGLSVRTSRPVKADPSWLTTPVLQLARVIRDEKDFTALPILSDALEESGCADPMVLQHCRGQREHVRGCWVVDMLLADR